MIKQRSTGSHHHHQYWDRSRFGCWTNPPSTSYATTEHEELGTEAVFSGVPHAVSPEGPGTTVSFKLRKNSIQRPMVTSAFNFAHRSSQVCQRDNDTQPSFTNWSKRAKAWSWEMRSGSWFWSESQPAAQPTAKVLSRVEQQQVYLNYGDNIILQMTEEKGEMVGSGARRPSSLSSPRSTWVTFVSL